MLDLMDIELIALGALIVLVIALAIVVGTRLARRRRVASRPEPTPLEAAPSIAFLERTGDDGSPRIYSIYKPLVVIGRDAGSDIHITPDISGALSVSRRHAQIRRDDVDFVVEDLGSQNGIRVNGLITRRNLLRDGYRVTFGKVEFVFRLSPSSDAARSR